MTAVRIRLPTDLLHKHTTTQAATADLEHTEIRRPADCLRISIRLQSGRTV
jgi:hypothetical protein